MKEYEPSILGYRSSCEISPPTLITDFIYLRILHSELAVRPKRYPRFPLREPKPRQRGRNEGAEKQQPDHK